MDQFVICIKNTHLYSGFAQADFGSQILSNKSVRIMSLLKDPLQSSQLLTGKRSPVPPRFLFATAFFSRTIFQTIIIETSRIFAAFIQITLQKNAHIFIVDWRQEFALLLSILFIPEIFLEIVILTEAAAIPLQFSFIAFVLFRRRLLRFFVIIAIERTEITFRRRPR